MERLTSTGDISIGTGVESTSESTGLELSLTIGLGGSEERSESGRVVLVQT